MPDPNLSGTALRYAAGDLPPDEAASFEARLAEDQDAREALAEAVRLSAAAIGQKPPAPHPSFRAAIRARVNLGAHRGHPFAWVGLGGAVVAVCTLVALSVGDRPPANTGAAVAVAAPASTEVAPAPHPIEPPAQAAGGPRDQVASGGATDAPEAIDCCDEPRSVAEIWADLSTTEHLEKARDDETRFRTHVRTLATPNHLYASVKAAGLADAPHP
ncbi:hypothetical protein [Frigoriglobus tundricola]|uniref:Zinc-finger domain-containing protein n=1 Tax=Frigoriglobus tundricola TaxID=2774151 RepID=A0A6M5YYI7_9BACT|nr:hypothetical protein [Frigoriglobus tundricola]QJW97982.1 hypothetical protein FTUN_5562 [Frigoriglobus tundricola]